MFFSKTHWSKHKVCQGQCLHCFIEADCIVAYSKDDLGACIDKAHSSTAFGKDGLITGFGAVYPGTNFVRANHIIVEVRYNIVDGVVVSAAGGQAPVLINFLELTSTDDW